MWRAVWMAGLLAVSVPPSSALAQVSTALNPYNPYVNSANGGALHFRSYSSVDRLNLQHQNRAASVGYFATSGANWTATNPSRAAAFRYYPHYPSLNAVQNFSRSSSAFVATAISRPPPLTPTLLIDFTCDPYVDEDGCLIELAGL